MADAVRKYLDARRRLDDIESDLNNVTGAVSTVAEALKNNRGRFMFSDIAPEMPPEIALGHTTRLSGDQWPTAERIQELLIRWHVARREALTDWNAIHKADQVHLKAPEH
mgnify:CR=1 FL=1